MATLSVRFAKGQNSEFQVGRLIETGQIVYDAPEYGTFDVLDEVLRQRY